MADTFKLAVRLKIHDSDLERYLRAGHSRKEALYLCIEDDKKCIVESLITDIVNRELIEFNVFEDNSCIEGSISIEYNPIYNYQLETNMILSKYRNGEGFLCTSDKNKIKFSRVSTDKISDNDKNRLTELGWTILPNSIERPKRKDTIV